MVAKARANPADPESFVALFIARSVKTSTGADLGRPSDSPGEISLPLIDVRLFLAAHLRGSKSAAPRREKAAAPLCAGESSLPTICSDFVERMGGWGQLGAGVVDVTSSLGIDGTYKTLGMDGMGSSIYLLLRALISVLHNNLPIHVGKTGPSAITNRAKVGPAKHAHGARADDGGVERPRADGVSPRRWA
jgi:hypothetical protein